MSRRLFALGVLVAATAVPAGSALAHGGSPSPRALPPIGPLPPGTGGKGAPGAAPTTPYFPGGLPVTTKTESADSWSAWWHYNCADLLRLKDELYRLRGTAGGETGEAAGNRGFGTRATEKRVREEVVPALLRAMSLASRQHPDTRAAAYIALAKTTDDPTHLDRIVAGVYRKDGSVNAEEDPTVRESAALSIGLLRRSDPARRFDVKVLDRARDAAFAMFDDGRLETRTRCFALLAVGLLGDQPTERTAEPVPEGDPLPHPRGAAARLTKRLEQHHPNLEFPGALLVALSLQPAEELRPDVVPALRDCVLRGRLFKNAAETPTRALAAEALGRVGGVAEAGPLLLATRMRSCPFPVQRAAAIALRGLVTRLDAPYLGPIVADLAKAADDEKEGGQRGLLVLAVGEGLAGLARRGGAQVLVQHHWSAVEWLGALVENAPPVVRSWAAIAGGLVLRSISDAPATSAEAAVVRMRFTPSLVAGFGEKSLDPHLRGAFAVSLGLARETGARMKLLAVVVDDWASRELRGYAALALGMSGASTPDVVKALRAGLSDSSPEDLRKQSATALGLLGVAAAVDLLVARLEHADGILVHAQVVEALGRIGDARALPPLVTHLENPKEFDVLRGLCCVGLGLVGDIEPVPSLSRITTFHDWSSPLDSLVEVQTIL